MKIIAVKKNIFLFAILTIGVFFILGSFSIGGGFVERPKVNYSNLDLAKKVEYDALIEKRQYLATLKAKKVNEFRIADKKYTENKSMNPFTHNQLVENKIKLTSDIDRIETEQTKVERQIDKIAEESNKSCFPSDIQVLMKDGTHKPISSITKGDEVIVYDIAKDTISNSTVNKVMISSNNHYYILNNSIKATAYERFLTQDGWKRIREIKEGDRIFNGNAYISVSHIEKIWIDDKVYNLNINSNHNFFVSYDAQNNMLVHNSGGGGGGGSDGGGK